MPYLAPEVVTRWSNAKKNLSTTLGKLKPGAAMSKERLDGLKKNLEAFDGGLTPKLKKAATAKTDKDAVIAIGESINIIKGYKSKVGEWGVANQAVITPTLKVLNEVQGACEAALVEINKNTPRR